MPHSELLRILVVSTLIVIARILDVSLDTMRIIYLSKGKKFLPPILGFFQVLIWLLAITEIFRHLDSFVYYFAYAVGFSLGNLIGISIEEKLAFGTLIIRVITRKDAAELLNYLKNEGHGFTAVNAEGALGSVKIIFMVIKRKNLELVMDIIKRFHPLAFVSIEEVREAHEGIFPSAKTGFHRSFFNRFKILRKRTNG